MFLLQLSVLLFSSYMEIVEVHVYHLESSMIVNMLKTNCGVV